MATVTGGDKFKRKLEEISRKASKAKHVDVGFMSDATYDNQGKKKKVALIAFFQEFGTPNARFPIPPRPYFRGMISKNKSEWRAQTLEALKTFGYDAKSTLDFMGRKLSAQLRDSIANTYSPKLSAVTVMLRGMRSHDQGLIVTLRTVFEAIRRVKEGKTNYGASTKPLEYSGHLLASVTHRVTT